ncbi:MAG TPA: hydrogenase nickel incorporation protein HypB [Chloroflexi bacterium]|jgi:hydrogenase nickel incorporation protein HypB|nr:hydrogenase nickel incorporation protein HypB [Chloroflexota bacterium]
MTPKRLPVVEEILAANDDAAARNRALLDAHGVHCVNVMASPGAGKTTLITQTALALGERRRLGVIEGDVASSVDTETVRALGLPAVQINTGGGCHLDAPQVGAALEQLPLDALDLLFIENVGNLICPVGFDLGEHTRLAIASVPEGDDKPHKYPGIYSAVDVLVVTKVDLLPYVPFDMATFHRLARSLNPNIAILEVSCTTGAGMDAWIAWLLERATNGRP